MTIAVTLAVSLLILSIIPGGLLSPGIFPLITAQAVFVFLNRICPPVKAMDKTRKRRLILLSGMILALAGCIKHSFINVIISWVLILSSAFLPDGSTVILTATILARLPDTVSSLTSACSLPVLLLLIPLGIAVIIASICLNEGGVYVENIKIPVSPSGIMPAVFAVIVTGIIKSLFSNIPIPAPVKGPLNLLALFGFAFLIVFFAFFFHPLMADVPGLITKLRTSGIHGVKKGNEAAYVTDTAKRAAAAGAALLTGIFVVSVDVLRQCGAGDSAVNLIITAGLLTGMTGGAPVKEGVKNGSFVWPGVREILLKTCAAVLLCVTAYGIAGIGNLIGTWIASIII